MPSITVQGVVLRFANYREHDRMLTLLSPDMGRIEVLSRGCRRPKSPLLPASELFVHGEFVLFQSGERYTLTGCAIEDTFYPLRLDPDRLICASYLLGLCQAAAVPGEAAGELFQLLLQGLYHLAYGTDEPPLSTLSAILLLFADVSGYRPRMNHCVHCRAVLRPEEGVLLDIIAGGLACPGCGRRSGFSIREEQVAWMKDTLRTGLTKQQQKTDASDMVSVLRRYVESRLETSIKAGKLLP